MSGCGPVGSKSMSLSVIYAAIAVLSLILFVGYCILIKERLSWFYLLFGSVAVVNTGYLALSLADSLQTAFMANRIAYLGSVFLPLAMLMIIMHTCRLECPTPVRVLLLIISIFVFLVAASPGILEIYYTNETSIKMVNGVAVLDKVYGPWHSLYMVYLIGYFTSMLCVIAYSSVKKKLHTVSHAIFLLVSVLINIAVWLAGQLVDMDFELLSISYIFTEIFLIILYMMIQEQSSTAPEVVTVTVPSVTENTAEDTVSEEDILHTFEQSIPLLTATERRVYDMYVAGKSTDEILSEMEITNNTLKYHNRNIYSKLGVSSRKQLIQLSHKLKTNNNME